MILYFSGCGNSRHVAEQLALLLEERLVWLNPNEANPSFALGPDEAFGIVCPVYAWAVPRLVTQYLERMQLSRKPSYCYLACTCGDSLGKTPERLARTLARKGLTLDAAYGFIMPETYVNLKSFKLDPPDRERQKKEAADQRLPLVAERIRRREAVIDVVRGPMPWVTSYVVNPLFYGLLITDRKFHVTADCIGCGQCAEHCPLDNIQMVEGRPTWQGHCTNCMGCYHRCPTNAIQFGKATQGKGQYRGFGL